ncbi:DUF7255 family protein [Arsenicicoccus sp. UBA7492]|uniref:DUF7255 family protein n=1 Tax=Arsenicicoccus sp. UBA7492 TaxID=1946057 RepID=UPI00257E7C3E|nr:hypothetical protein [Arsenicicoccus sp. UBA7492]
MTTPGEREKKLCQLLDAAGMTTSDRPARPRMQHLGDLAEVLERTYRDLGGRMSVSPERWAPGGWDMALDGVLVELDEEQHFNRYRKRTLDDDWADVLPWARFYSGYCDDYEHACDQASSSLGGRSTQSSRLMFGPAAVRGLDSSEDLSRWKQRAFYDAIRDAYAMATRTPLARLSVHDDIEGHSLNQILRDEVTCSHAALRALVQERTYRP